MLLSSHETPLIAALAEVAADALRKIGMNVDLHESDWGTLVHTDEHGTYARLPAQGDGHKTICHGRGDYARDGFCEVHVDTIEDFWSLQRSWLRPHRGISQDNLPRYLGFLQFMHDARRRGKAPLGALITAPVR